jgi:hypothetical protein
MMSGTLWVLAIACLVVLLFSGATGAVSIYVYLTVRNRRSEDASVEQIEPLAPAQPLVAALTGLGFRRLGEARTRLALPGGTGIAWVLVDPEGTTQAEVVASPPLLALTSVYADEAVVETGYPLGEQIDTPSFRSHTVAGSVEAAYRHHLEQAADFGAAHGAPQRIASMAGYFRWDRSYRLHHAQRKMRRLFLVNGVLPMVAAVYIAVVGAYSLLAGWWQGTGTAAEAHGPQLLLLLAPGLVVTGITGFLTMVGTSKKARG